MSISEENDIARACTIRENDIVRACTILRLKYTEVSIEESKSSIYRLHRHLRNVNPKAYEPEIVSIGPYHRGKDDLKMMEEHKLRYLHLLVKRRSHTSLEKYFAAVAELEPKARKCYAEPISLNAREFVEMLVLDGCFIIELVRKYVMVRLRQTNDPIFRMDWMLFSLQRDLILFENQIPFFVLQVLFDLIVDPNQDIDDLKSLLLMFFRDIFPGKPNRDIAEVISSQHEIKHLLHLIHCIWLPSVDQREEKREKRWLSSAASSMIRVDKKKRKDGKEEKWRFINSVAGLREANVKFEKDEQLALFDIKFENGTMRIAPLMIDDGMETFFRNLIAYEQYADEEFSPVTDYGKFLDCLVNSSKDVEILSRLEIVDNWLGDDEVVARMVNRLGDVVAGPGYSFRYAEIFRDVKKHCGKRRNKWMAKLRRNYLHSPWAIISIVVALLLLLLTVTQTLFSVLQVI